MTVKGSYWFDNSAGANKLRNSYLKGFLDISGGGISIRNATGQDGQKALNFYSDTTDVAKVRMDADKFRVPAPSNNLNTNWYSPSNVDTVDGSGQQIDISMSDLGYLSGISRNIERSLVHLHAIVDSETSSFGDVSANTVAVVADATIGGRLYVNSDINGNGNLTIAKNAYIGGRLTVEGETTINADFYVRGNSHLDGNVFLKEDLHVYEGNIYAYKSVYATGDLFAGEDLFVSKTLNTTGDASLNGNLFVNSDASFNGRLSVQGDISSNGTIYCSRIVIVNDVSDNGSMEVATDMDIAGRLLVTGDASLNSKLYVDKAATLNDTLNVAKAATLSSTLSVAKAATLSDTLSVAKAATLSSTLDVTGIATLSDALSVAKAATLSSTLSVTKAATLSDALSVAKEATLSSTLDVTGIATFTNKIVANADASLNSTLHVAGAATFNDTLSVAKAATLSSTLSVTAAATLSSTLAVSGDATFDKHIGAFDMSAGMFQAGRLIMEDNYNSDNMENYIRTTGGDINIRAGDGSGAYGNVHIKSNLIVDGSINFAGTITQTNVNIQVSEQLDISANSNTAEPLKVEQNFVGATVATFYNKGSSATPVMAVGYNNVAINKTSADTNYNFDVAGNAQISSKLIVGGAVEFSTTLKVDGNYSSEAGNLTLSNGKITTNTLEVTSTSTFNDVVTMKAGLDMQENTFINQIGNEIW